MGLSFFFYDKILIQLEKCDKFRVRKNRYLILLNICVSERNLGGER